MAVTAARKTTITYSEDVSATHVLAAADNASSPGTVEIKTLASGNNTITLPTSGATSVSVTIVPPSGNTVAITLKGVNDDTGFRLHNTDPSTLTFHSTVTTFVLNAGAEITGVRLYWT